jgi:photosystem II stability/assembly factor-like uncharacterized protein
MDDKTGWIATPLQLGVTKDGGITWKELTLPEGIKDIAAIALRTVTDGYLLDTEGTLFITQDAGETWSSRSLGLYEGEELDPNSYTPMAAMRFLDTDWGLVALSLTEKGKLKALVMRTVDGGLTWKRESVPVKYGTLYLAHDGSTLTVVDFVNAKQFTVLRRQEQ